MGTLFECVASFPNLLQAARLAARGKRVRPNVAAFGLNLEEELHGLQQELLARTYRPGPYRTFLIREKKPRFISAAPFRDRVVHHALSTSSSRSSTGAFSSTLMPVERGKVHMRRWSGLPPMRGGFAMC